MAHSINRFRSLLLVLLSVWIRLGTSLTISYCSSQNTAQAGPFYWQFQSNGHCQDTCKFQYAYAVLQGNNCWCSNYAPYDQTDNGQCDVNCPGFPSEKCGNQDQGLYGYYLLDVTPSGTAGAPTQAQTSDFTLPGAATTVTATVLATVTSSRITTTSVFTSSSVRSGKSSIPVIPFRTIPASFTQYSHLSATISTPSTKHTPPGASQTTLITSNTGSTSSFKPTPITIVTTVQGSIQTVTVTPTQPSSAADTNMPTTSDSDSFFSNTGKVAGTFTVVALVIVAVLVALGIFFWKRRRSSDSVAIRSVSDHDGHSTTGRFFGSSAEKRHSKLGLNTTGIGGRGDSHERTPTMATPVSMSRRTSHPLVHDQRLNPNALYAMGQDNGSHVSVGSFQDDRDYSRPVLHIRNPDEQSNSTHFNPQ